MTHYPIFDYFHDKGWLEFIEASLCVIMKFLRHKRQKCVLQPNATKEARPMSIRRHSLSYQ